MLAPARERDRTVSKRGMRSQTQPLPVPWKGWNTEQPLTAMEPEFAPVLRNWWPEPDGIRPRGGYVEQASGLGGPVASLMSYVSGLTKRLFAASGANIFDVTAPGPVGAAAWSTATADRWQSLNVATSGGQFLMAVNGADHPINFNGIAWSASPAITGVAGGANSIVNLFLSQKRVFLIKKDSADIYYLSPASIGGAASLLPLGQELKKGGAIIAGGTWSSDSGAGMDDRTVFISSEGEVLIFGGTDPSSTTTWALEGRYEIGRPLGYRCAVNFGGDLAILTQDGLMSLAAVRQLDRTAAQQGALTRNIRQAFASAVRSDVDTFGWQTIGFSRGQMVIVNVPNLASGETRQFVMNTLSSAWAEYTEWEALCWVEHDNRVYFGTAEGVVNEAERGSIDGISLIQCFAVGAFNSLAQPDAYKTALELKIFYEGGAGARIYTAIGVDYDLDPVFEEYNAQFLTGYYFTWDLSAWDASFWVGGETTGSSQVLVWNVGNWNETFWAGGERRNTVAQSVFGSGYALAVGFRTVVADGSPAREPGLKLQRFDLTYEVGSAL